MSGTVIFEHELNCNDRSTKKIFVTVQFMAECSAHRFEIFQTTIDCFMP
jgi:hypothetical protein